MVHLGDRRRRGSRGVHRIKMRRGRRRQRLPRWLVSNQRDLWHDSSAGAELLEFFLAKVVPPLTLSVQRVASTARISINATNGARFALESSPTMTAGSWTNLLTNTVSATPFIYTETIPAGTTRRFYRARRVP